MSDLQKVGPDFGGTGTFKPFTATLSGAQRTADAHARFMAANLEGRMFSAGGALTSINAATFTTGTTGATATPIIGLWNPATSPVNLVVLQATLGVTMTSVTATGGGPYVWMVCTGNSVISTGVAPFSAKTLVATGAYAKVFSAAAALTGMTGTLAIIRASALCGGSAENVSFVATAVAMQTQQTSSVENFDGSLIIPPGGVLALMATTTPVAHSAVAGMVWEEVPILA